MCTRVLCGLCVWVYDVGNCIYIYDSVYRFRKIADSDKE